MAKTCSKCKRLNPPDALYCYFDGIALDSQTVLKGPINVGQQAFPYPFLFAKDRSCRNFDELVTACQNDWTGAVDALGFGSFMIFFGTIGRADLAQAAHDAASFPDRDRGLDQLLGKLPSKALSPAKVEVLTRELNFGPLSPGDDVQGELRLTNRGKRLAHGWISSDCGWIMLGSPPGAQAKMFQFGTDLTIPVLIRTKLLRTGPKPVEARLTIDPDDGESLTVPVRVSVPVKDFPEGVLAGARSPRQLAIKAKDAPRAAAVLFENGAVARWYESNSWIYPVKAPAASGLAAIQQYFEALGLVPAPAVELGDKSINLTANPGATLQHVLTVKTKEKRAVWAHATSNQPWLEIGKTTFTGRSALLPLTIRTVVNRIGDMQTAEITVIANGNQRFKVPVSVTIGSPPAPPRPPAQAAPAPAPARVAVPPAPAAAPPAPPKAAPPAPSGPNPRPAPAPAAVPPAPPKADPRVR